MYVRPDIAAIEGYVPGEQPRGGKFIKLNTNENPYPCSAAVTRAMQSALESGLQRYPDPMAEAFRRRAGEVLGIEPNWIMCGNGSDDILTIATRAFVGARRSAAAAISELHPLQNARPIAGSRVRGDLFPSDWSLGDDFSARRDRLKLAFLPNPNSPSGTLLSPDRILRTGRSASLPAAGR